MLEKYKNKKLIIIAGIVLLAILPFIIEWINFGKIIITKQTIIRISLVYGIYAVIGLYKFVNKFLNKKIKIMVGKIIKYRYLIALIVFIILVALKINFSSLDIWINYLNEDPDTLSSTILGSPKAIRSDEWMVYTPLMLAQAQNDNWYDQYNSNVEQGNYNMMINNLPVANITIISHPFQWGFLLFGIEYGYSWYWAMKMILLFLVSTELVLVITKKDELISLAGGILLALAPCMMWWLSTSIVDAYIYGVAIIVLFHYYMENINTHTIKSKILLALGILIVIPGFAMTLYPAYQIPLAYLIACFLIVDLIEHFKDIKKKDYLIMSITLILSIGMIIFFIINSWNDIQIEMNTVYPGSRFETGGSFGISNFVQYFTNIYLFTNQSVATTNACEVSTYLYPFIATLILIVYTIFKLKDKVKENKLFVGLLLIFVLLFSWCYIGFNNILAKMTFLYNSQAERTGLVLGLTGVLIWIYLVKKYENQKIFTKAQAIIITLIITLASFIVLKSSSYFTYFSNMKLELILLLFFCLTYFTLTTNKKALSIIIVIVAIIAGAFVNPVTRGTKIFNKTNLYNQIQKVKEEDKDALWIGYSNTNAQYLMAAGVNVLNGVNIYPNFKWLKQIDPDEKFNEVYNRYAHISIELGEETNFVLIYGDAYKVVLTYDDIKKIGISYFFTTEAMNENVIEQFHLEKIYSETNKNQYIYKFN